MFKIDELIETLVNLAISENNEMATASQERPLNYQLLRLYIDTIPNFNGDSSTLEVFLEHCEFLINTYQNVQNIADPINSFLIRAAISKLSGDALILVGSRPEIREWDQLKDLLRLTFGDQRNLDCLVQEMIIMRPFKNESFFAFGQRIQKGRSGIASKLKSMKLRPDECTFKIKNYDELALKTFIRGLSGRVQDMVRLRNPNSLELAISYVLEEENFMLSQRQNQSIQNSLSNAQRNSQQKPSINHNFKSQFRPNFTRPAFASPNFAGQRPFSIQQFRPQFQSYLSSSQQRQNISQPNISYNQQSYGQQSNVFRPTGQTPQYRPEPMSISTRNTTLQKPHSSRNQNSFRPTGPPNFVSQEVYNIESSANNDFEFENPFSSQNYEYYDGVNTDAYFQETPEQYEISHGQESCYKTDDTNEQFYHGNTDDSHEDAVGSSNFTQASSSTNAT